MRGSDGGEAGAAFAQTLTSLKREGSSLLVVGYPLAGSHHSICDRLLGHDDQPRRRIHVQTAESVGIETTHAPAAGAAERVIVTGNTTRDATGVLSDGVTQPAITGGSSPDLETIRRAVTEAIEDLQPEDGYDPAELRVCIGSIVPLLADYDRDAVIHQLERIGNCVIETNGIVHVHFPVDRDEVTVSDLKPLFDGVIELRWRDGGIEHNWQLMDRDVESGWLTI